LKYIIRVKDFPNHEGRPGLVGGSKPKGSANIFIADDPGNNTKIYEIHDASDLLKFDTIAISIRGKYKGRVIAANADSHEEMLHYAGIIGVDYEHGSQDMELDNWVRLAKHRRDGGLYAETSFAAEDMWVGNHANEALEHQAINNIYKACDYLVSMGLPKTTRLHIDVIFGNNIIATVEKQLKSFPNAYRPRITK
jgi:hypothetical protein